MISLVSNAFCILRHANDAGLIFKYFQVQTHVQTASESPDLNMDFVHLTMGVNSYTNRYLCKNSCLSSNSSLFFPKGRIVVRYKRKYVHEVRGSSKFDQLP